MLIHLVLLFTTIFVFHVAAGVRVVCYYGSWSSYSGYNPGDFDANLCTHINYAFMGVWDDGNVKVGDDNLDINQGLYYSVTDMKKRNPNLKVLLSVGGDTGSGAFSAVAADPAKRGAFVGSATYFISTYHFDGLDIDWEYPESGDTGNFITLLNQLKGAFAEHGWLLTAAVTANPSSHGYDVRQMSNILDWINVMTYDMYGSWSAYTGQCSPLYSSSIESSWEKQNLNLAAAANNWVNAGAPKEKLSVGLAFYGRSFTLADSNQNGLHAPISGGGVEGGSVPYREICSKYASWNRVWDDQQKNPYKYSGNQWFGYDDQDSIWIKTDYIKNNGFGGVMIWSLDLDDVHGKCGEKQVLLKHVNRPLGRI